MNKVIKENKEQIVLQIVCMLVSALILFVIYGINKKNIEFVVTYEVESIIVIFVFKLPTLTEKIINRCINQKADGEYNANKKKKRIFEDADMVASAAIIILGVQFLSNVAEKCIEIIKNPEILNISTKGMFGILALAIPYMLPVLMKTFSL